MLRGQLKELKRDIRADQIGKKEFEDHLYLLEKQKELLMRRLSANEKWAAEFDEAIGPFERKYSSLTKDISGLYDAAKEEHAKGLLVLIEEFNYHPAFKRWCDNFTAIPFKPK